MTFDSISGQFDAPYVEGGLQVTCSVGCPSPIGALYSFGAGDALSADPSSTSATISNFWGGAELALTSVSGLPFDLTSIDFADYSNGGDAAPFVVTWRYAGDSTVNSALLSLDAAVGLETFTVNLAGLAFFTWQSQSGPFSSYLQADNVTAAVSGVPIPAALPLFAVALGGLGFVGWRRRKSAQTAA